MKTNTRKRMALIRNTLNLKDQKAFSELIEKQVLNMDEYQNAQTVLLYCSFGSEVYTNSLIEKCLKDKKNTLLPHIVPKTKTIKALKINDFEKDTKTGHIKIIEPKENCEEFSKKDIDLIIVPGLAFGIKGERLGYGKGFYDRFLKGCSGRFVAICFDVQITRKIIPESHDVDMHKIVTEKRVIDCEKNKALTI